jgi:predicted nucleotidyltransferase
MRKPPVAAFRLTSHSNRRSVFRSGLLLIALAFTISLLTLFFDGRIAEAVAPSFAAKQDFTVPMAQSVATGDVNGDGKTDLVVATLQDSHVSVLLNTTAPGAAIPSFAAKQDFATPFSAVGVALGDLNGDGTLDVAIVCNNPTNSASVFLNTTAPGSTTMTFAARQDFSTGISPLFITMGDLNMDGRLDLAIASSGTTSVSVFLNTTAPGAAVPSFAAKQDFATGIGNSWVAIGDMNNDGKPDLASANNTTNTVSVLLNATAPGAVTCNFAPKQDFVVGNQPASVVVGDLNGDGKLDVATSHTVSSKASVRFNTTAPGAAVMSLSAVQVFDTGTGPFSIGLRDLNGDGRADLVTPNRDANTVSVLLNTTAPGADTPTFSSKADLTVGSQPLTVAFADFNGDGKPDITSANRNDGTVSVLLNTTAIDPATPSFTAKQDFGTGANPLSVRMGDVNGDGNPDLAVANVNSNTVSVLLNNTTPGAATPSLAAKQDFATGPGPGSVATGDVNGDGKLDLAVTNTGSGGNTVSVLLNTTAPGAAVPSFALKQDFASGSLPRSVTMGDLNGDGKLDLAFGNNGSANVSVLLNTTAPGDVTVSFAARQDFATAAGPFSVTLGDLNGDGKLDLAVVNESASNLSVLLNTTAPGATTPSFAPKQDFATGPFPVSVTAGDLNGDGRLDLAVASQGSNNASVLLNTTAPGAATPSFAAKQDFATGSLPIPVALGDVNGDGKLDLVVPNNSSNNVSVLLNTTVPGAATLNFTARQDFATGVAPRSITLGDLNGDGKPDLAVANQNDNTLSVLLNSPSVVPTTGLSRQQGSASTNSQIATATNYGGNGGLTVTVTSANPVNGVTISNIVNTNGNVTADIVASCIASNASFTLQATDGSSTVTTTLSVTVTANTPPTLVYSSPQSVAFNGSLNLSPTTAIDNGLIVGFAVQSVTPALTTVPTVNASGAVSITSAQPPGAHLITIRATDNCGFTTDRSFTLNVAKDDQTISFGALANKTFGDADFSVSATATSGLPVSFGATGNCTVTSPSPGTVHLTAAGPCTITATQAGDSTYNAAPIVQRSFNIAKANQTITFGALADKTFGDADFNVSAAASSGLAVSFGATGNCTVTSPSPGTVHITGAGSCTITASQAGNSNYNAAPNVSQSFNIAKSNQTITFGTLGNKTFGDADFNLSATASSGLVVSFSATGQCTVTGTTVHLTGPGSCTITASQAGDANFNAAPDVARTFNIAGPIITLSQSTYSQNEAAGFVTITVNRSGALSIPVTVDYVTDDTGASTNCSTLNSGKASARCDFGLALGRLQFAAGDTQKTFVVAVTQDSYAEGSETFAITLSNLTGNGAVFGTFANGTATINDSVPPAPNASDDTDAFVRQQYRDFLNRDADASGLAFWKDNIDSCNDPARRPSGMTLVQCIEVRRIDTSAAFFLSIEFQQTGYIVERTYKVSYGNTLGTSTLGGTHQLFVPGVRLNEFLKDTQRIGQGVVVLQLGWEQALEANKQAYFVEFVQTSRFITTFPTNMTPAQFVDDLNAKAGNVLTQLERTQAINLFGGSGDTSNINDRALAVRQVAENQTLFNTEFNRAFVLAEFFGYLRRNPNDSPDTDYSGYAFWLGKLNQFQGNYINAEMVKAFLSSLEYRNRFGP